MIVEYIRYNLPSGLNAQFEADYAKAAEFLKASSVCLGYDLTPKRGRTSTLYSTNSLDFL